jgi:hypothetical protein
MPHECDQLKYAGRHDQRSTDGQGLHLTFRRFDFIDISMPATYFLTYENDSPTFRRSTAQGQEEGRRARPNSNLAGRRGPKDCAGRIKGSEANTSATANLQSVGRYAAGGRPEPIERSAGPDGRGMILLTQRPRSCFPIRLWRPPSLSKLARWSRQRRLAVRHLSASAERGHPGDNPSQDFLPP